MCGRRLRPFCRPPLVVQRLSRTYGRAMTTTTTTMRSRCRLLPPVYPRRPLDTAGFGQSRRPFRLGFGFCPWSALTYNMVVKFRLIIARHARARTRYLGTLCDPSCTSLTYCTRALHICEQTKYGTFGGTYLHYFQTMDILFPMIRVIFKSIFSMSVNLDTYILAES